MRLSNTTWYWSKRLSALLLSVDCAHTMQTLLPWMGQKLQAFKKDKTNRAQRHGSVDLCASIHWTWLSKSEFPVECLTKYRLYVTISENGNAWVSSFIKKHTHRKKLDSKIAHDCLMSNAVIEIFTIQDINGTEVWRQTPLRTD